MPKTHSRKITIAHSPDSDDAFMLYALATNKIDTGDIEFGHVLKDIQTLNEEAASGAYEVTAISFHAYAHVADKYLLLPHGASIGDNYGPVVVSNDHLEPSDLSQARIAVPGTLTTAFLTLRLFNSDFTYEVVPFEEIIDAVLDGRCDAGLLIHEGQLYYHSKGLQKVLDLGEWWHEHTSGLPLPMGGNAIRRDLGEETIHQVSDLLKESIQYAMENREDALAYAMQFARDMDPGLTDRYVGLWVNEMALDYGDRGREAVRRLLREGHEQGIIPTAVEVQFAD